VGVRAGDSSPRKHDRQPSLFAYALLAVHEASATPHKRGNKKAQIPLTYHEPRPTAPSVDNAVDNFKS
jgi:hypothetical protein